MPRALRRPVAVLTHIPNKLLLAVLATGTALAGCQVSERATSLPHSRAQQGLVVHEWGTYTSLQGSDGRSMDGLHHAEHLLPAFVLARDVANPDQKGVEGGGLLPAPVNQKLETPVLYFYDQQMRTVDVSVRFPGGIISEWYPSPIEMSPPIGGMTEMANGSMKWQVELVPRTAIAAPQVESDGIWAPSRRVRALGVRHADQDEHFIFYRGLGRFERPIRVTSSGEHLTVRNDSRTRIPAAFLLTVTDHGGAIVALGEIGAAGSVERSIPTSLMSIDPYIADAKAKLKTALVATGLYDDEAQAMVDTWEASYFETPGTRVLYVAPQMWADELLPIELDPKPVEMVRTFVGRIEVVTETAERQIVQAVEAAANGGPPIASDTYGRFTEPMLRRALELIDDERTKAHVQYLVDTFSRMP